MLHLTAFALAVDCGLLVEPVVPDDVEPNFANRLCKLGYCYAPRRPSFALQARFLSRDLLCDQGVDPASPVGFRELGFCQGTARCDPWRPSWRSWPTLAKPTLANRVWPALFGDRVWPNRLWPALVFWWYGRLWPKPTLAKTDFGQNRLWAKPSSTCVVCFCVCVFVCLCVCAVWRGCWFHGFMVWGFTCGCWFQGFWFGHVRCSRNRPSRDRPSREPPSQDRPSRDRPSRDRPPPGRPPPGRHPPDRPPPDRPKFRSFFPSPAAKFVLFFPLWGSSRGILVVFEGRDPQMCTRRGFTRQPENSKCAHLRVPSFKHHQNSLRASHFSGLGSHPSNLPPFEPQLLGSMGPHPSPPTHKNTQKKPEQLISKNPNN